MASKNVKVRNVRLFGIAVAALLLSACTSSGRDACEDIKVPLTDELEEEYVKLTSEALKTSDPGPIAIESILVSGAWSVAYIIPEKIEAGYAFFEDSDGQKTLKGVWGGVATSDERPEVVTWAEELGAPTELAACFASRAASD